MRDRRGRTRRRIAGLLVLGTALIAAALSVTSLWRPRARDEAPVPDPTLSIEVLNGCGIPGVADRVAGILRRAGYTVTATGNADHFHYRGDIVVARRVSLERARAVGWWLGGVPVVEQMDPGATADIAVVVGSERPVLPERR